MTASFAGLGTRSATGRVPPRKSASVALRAALRALGVLAGLLAAIALADPARGDGPASPLAPPTAMTVRAHLFDEAPVLDGSLGEWAAVGEASRARLGRLEQGHPSRRARWKGPQDASADVRVGVHAGHLYLGVAVQDDRVHHDLQGAWWHGDSIELFVNADLPAQDPPPHRYTPNCWQILLMPANREIPWGVVYRGPRMHFNDAGLRGVRVAAGPPRPGGIDFEVRIPLDNFGIEGLAATRLGFALALNDSDTAPEEPGTYLSWNQGFDLYLHPDHFGVLEIPSRRAPDAIAPAPDGPGPWWPLLAALVAAAAAALLAGPGARVLARVGPRAKWIGLGVTALLALGVYLERGLSLRAVRGEARAELETLADHAEAIAREARSLGALTESDGARRTRSLRQLLAGEGIDCRPGVEDAALVPLHDGGGFYKGAVPEYAFDLRRTQDFLLPRAATGRRFAVRLGPSFPGRDRDRAVLLGRLTFTAASGATESVPVALGADGSDGSGGVLLTLERPQPWRRLRWDPDPGAPPAALRGVDALGAEGERERLLLSGRTLDGVPVLAHPGGADSGRDVPAGEAITLDVPTLTGADRLWVLLRADRAFPRLLGDQVLARVGVEYASGAAAAPLELRNAEHLTAERIRPGIRTPPGVARREAFRWRDNMGYTHVQNALPIPLDPRRPARTLRIENSGAGGTLRVVAATVVRTRRTPPGARVQLLTDRWGADAVVLAGGQPDFGPHLGAASQDGDDPSAHVTVQRVIGAQSEAVTLRLDAPLPGAATSGRGGSRIVLLACLAVALFLLVLLVVDGAGRLRHLSYRLVAGVLAAALVPLGVTILLVERENTARVEAEHTARVRTALQQVGAQLDAAQGRVEEAAGQLARHLVNEGDPGQITEVHRLVGLYGGSVLSPGLSGTASISGARLPRVHIPLVDPNATGGAASSAGLRSPRYLDGLEDGQGLRTSPWDGLVLVATSRSGNRDDWVRVAIGVRVDDAFLVDALRGTLDDGHAAGVILGGGGRPLARAGPGGDALAKAVWRQADLGTETGGSPRTAVLKRAGSAAPFFLAVAAPLSEPAGAQDDGAWLALGLDRAIIDRAVAEQRTLLLGLGLFGLVLIVGVAALVARRVADPVRDLVRVADAVRQGRFDVEVPTAGADEVGRLTVAFDQMRRDLKHRVEDLHFLRSAQQEVAGTLDFAARAGAVLAVFQARFRGDEALLLDVRDRRGPATVVAEASDAPRFVDRPFALAEGGWLANAVAADGPTELDPGMADVARMAEHPMGERLLGRCPAWVAVPLRAGTESQGLLLLGWKDAADIPRGDERRLMDPLAGIAAAALNNARLYRLAALDEVTRLPGATAFEAALRNDVEAAVGGGAPAVLLRIGLDHVEHVGLRRGVELARELVRACAQALLAAVGDRVRLGRLREEQLAVRLPGVTADEARTLAETIRERIRAVEVRADAGGEGVGTTVSIGIAYCPGDARSLEFLLDAAARAMAAAQSEGGDRVEEAARLGGAVEVPPFEDGAIFRNRKMVQVVESARRSARTDASVLITGETGTGKEVIADLIHRRSNRASRPFVTVNCAAFPESLLESELFGHERGAFTGAERRREGRFELADGGTLFLDEVAEMTPSAQVKLLRVLQERQFTRLGGTRTVTVDVRIIAATNQELERAVAEGRFREDLYYRLNVIRLEIPPLRERREEIPPLVDLFLRDASRRCGGGPSALTSAAMDVLYRHPWPGNVRELKNVIERCVVLCEADRVGPEHLQLDVTHGEGAPFLAPQSAPQDDLNPRQRRLLEYLARHGRCTNREYYEMAETSPRTGLRDLQDLMTRGLLVREGKRRGAVYRLA